MGPSGFRLKYRIQFGHFSHLWSIMLMPGLFWSLRPICVHAGSIFTTYIDFIQAQYGFIRLILSSCSLWPLRSIMLMLGEFWPFRLIWAHQFNSWSMWPLRSIVAHGMQDCYKNISK